MPKIINGHTLDYTTDQLNYFESEMRKFRLPWITKVHKKYGVPFIRYSFFPALVVIAILGILSMNDPYSRTDWAFVTAKWIGLFYIFGFGGFTLISHIAERISTNRLRRRLGLPKTDFAILVIAFQITGM